jgi:pantetheine-phosphate adenylyltransferase
VGLVGVFPATFDPVTNGHVSIAERAASIFPRLVVGVYAHDDATIKRPLFDVDERVALVREAVSHVPNAEVRSFSGLAVDFARAEGAAVIVRGLRVADDFEFERQMAMMNRHLEPEVETLLLISEPMHAFVSASIVREVALMGGDVSGLVPPAVARALAGKAGAGTATERGAAASERSVWPSTSTT